MYLSTTCILQSFRYQILHGKGTKKTILRECAFLIQRSDNKSLKCEINNYDINFKDNYIEHSILVQNQIVLITKACDKLFK